MRRICLCLFEYDDDDVIQTLRNDWEWEMCREHVFCNDHTPFTVFEIMGMRSYSHSIEERLTRIRKQNLIQLDFCEYLLEYSNVFIPLASIWVWFY